MICFCVRWKTTLHQKLLYKQTRVSIAYMYFKVVTYYASSLYFIFVRIVVLHVNLTVQGEMWWRMCDVNIGVIFVVTHHIQGSLCVYCFLVYFVSAWWKFVKNDCYICVSPQFIGGNFFVEYQKTTTTWYHTWKTFDSHKNQHTTRLKCVNAYFDICHK